jgi:transposase InsO family protein
MVNKVPLLRNKQAVDVKVLTANQQVLTCTLKGEAIVKTDTGEQVHLKEVLLLPALTCNLLSVRKVNEAGLKVEFTKNGNVTFMPQAPRRLLMSGRASGSLYELVGDALTLSMVASAANNPSTSISAPSNLIATRFPQTLGALWHRRLGHLNYTSQAKMAANRGATELPTSGVFSHPAPCWSCTSGKLPRKPFPVSANRTCRPMEQVHTDIAGPMQVTSAGGARYFVTVLDDYTQYTAVKPIAKKSEAADFIKHIIKHWEGVTGHSTLAVRSDRGKEYMSDALKQWYEDRGIQMQPTSGYSPQENGAAERLNRTLWETVLTMLADSGLPRKWWSEAVVHAAFLRNVTSRTGGMTPWELMRGVEPDVGTVKVFGAPCMVKVPDQKRHKLNLKAEPGRLLGFDQPNLKAYRVLTFKGVLVQSRDIVAQEYFESKADRRMQYFEIEAGITQPKPSSPTPVTTTSPVSIPAAVPVPSINSSPPDCTAPVSIPTLGLSGPDNTLQSPEDDETSQQTAHGHRSTRINKGKAQARLEPTFEGQSYNAAVNFCLVQRIPSVC